MDFVDQEKAFDRVARKVINYSINPLARGSDLKTIRVRREHEIGTAAARVYYKRLLG